MPYKDEKIMPDPSFTLTLGNTIAPESNFYAIQKTYEGPFILDVIFDSKSAGSAITGKFLITLCI